MENPIKFDDLGVPPFWVPSFQETSMCIIKRYMTMIYTYMYDALQKMSSNSSSTSKTYLHLSSTSSTSINYHYLFIQIRIYILSIFIYIYVGGQLSQARETGICPVREARFGTSFQKKRGTKWAINGP